MHTQLNLLGGGGQYYRETSEMPYPLRPEVCCPLALQDALDIAANEMFIYPTVDQQIQAFRIRWVGTHALSMVEGLLATGGAKEWLSQWMGAAAVRRLLGQQVELLDTLVLPENAMVLPDGIAHPVVSDYDFLRLMAAKAPDQRWEVKSIGLTQELGWAAQLSPMQAIPNWSEAMVLVLPVGVMRPTGTPPRMPDPNVYPYPNALRVEEAARQVEEVEAQAEQLSEVKRLQDEIGRLTDLLRQRHRDLDTIGQALLEEAENRSWCSEYDTFVNTLNNELTYGLPTRTQEVTGTVTGYVSVPFTYTVTIDEHPAGEDATEAILTDFDYIDASDLDFDWSEAEVTSREITEFGYE